MNVTLRTPKMTREQFLDWVERQEAPYEFDGFEPVAMTGGNRRHARTCRNLVLAVARRLEGSNCELLPEAGVATIGSAVRYPDALITCTQGSSRDRLMPGVVVAFEVVSPTSGRTDRNIKLREYRAVPSIRRYVILDNEGPDLTVYARTSPDQDWTATPLTTGEALPVPEAGIEVPVDEFYRGVSFDEDPAA
jgi:Uma2 family endonuclease